ncbi:hypothetical protein J4480_04660 [Candidatus Woesearchaeota archaeon]|nr:hypothetical protein [Candidatus Woesearchaeota archaeon]
MISNATALICLSRINKLSLLKKVYSVVVIPSAVKIEVLVKGKEGYTIINNAIKNGWIRIADPKNNINLGLGAGENQAINLARERKDSILLDDAFAIKAAKALEIPVARTTTFIFTALKKKLITKAEALNCLNLLIETGYYISPMDYAALISELK